jgi:UDP-N-acetylglucosamine acyltransferase
MRRRKFTRERLHKVRSFYQRLFFGPGQFADRVKALAEERAEDPAVAEILDFVSSGDKRPIVMPDRSSNGTQEA